MLPDPDDSLILHHERRDTIHSEEPYCTLVKIIFLLMCCNSMMWHVFNQWYTLLTKMASVPKSNTHKRDGPKKKEIGKGCISEAQHTIAKTVVSTNHNIRTEALTKGRGWMLTLMTH